MPTRRRRPRPWLCATILSLVAACSSAGEPSLDPDDTLPPESRTITAEADGYVLTVEVDRTVVPVGEAITFEAAFTNTNPEPIDIAPASCRGVAAMTAIVDVPLDPGGRAWDGAAGTFKAYALNEGLGPGGVPATDPLRVSIAGPCSMSVGSTILEAGGTATGTYTW